MNLLSDNMIFGKLTIHETFEFYDFPRLFTCKNNTGQYYLVLSIDETESSYDWYYLALSNDRLQNIKAQKLSLFEAFKKPENGFIYFVSIEENNEDKVSYLFPEQVDDDLLPFPDEYLTVDSSSKYGLGDINPQQAALSTRRNTINIHLKPNDTKLVELNTKNLGGILISFQELVDAVGQKHNGTPTISGSIPYDILNETRLNTCQIFEGSFGLQLKANSLSDIFNNSFLTETINLLGSLFDAKDNEPLLKKLLHEYEGRVASKYRRFLKELTKINSELLIDWGSPNQSFGGSYNLSRQEVSNAFKIVDLIDMEMADAIEIRCTLIGANVRTRSYEILSSADNEKFSGKFSEDALQDVSSATINNTYIAKLRKITEVQSSSGYEKIKWLLIGLSEISAEDS